MQETRPGVLRMTDRSTACRQVPTPRHSLLASPVISPLQRQPIFPVAERGLRTPRLHVCLRIVDRDVDLPVTEVTTREALGHVGCMAIRPSFDNGNSIR